MTQLYLSFSPHFSYKANKTSVLCVPVGREGVSVVRVSRVPSRPAGGVEEDPSLPQHQQQSAQRAGPVSTSLTSSMSACAAPTVNINSVHSVNHAVVLVTVIHYTA